MSTGAKPAMRRRPVMLALVAAFAVIATGCNSASWGLRTSYRDYVTSSGAQGQISATDGATWDTSSGTGTGKGPITWPIEYATYNATTQSGVIQYRGTGVLQAHPSGGAYVLDQAVSNPRLEFSGNSGTLYVDLNYRPNVGATPELLEAALDVPFATVDLSNQTLTPDADGTYRISAAPTTGITAAMQHIGWDAFYGDPVALDPFTATFNPDAFAPALASTPQIVVSRTTGLNAGDQINVWGYGFDPTAHSGTRPPLSGQPSGVYVTFGKFATNWQPSTGAASSTRVVLSQRWALPAASRAVLDPTGTNDTYVTIDEYGRFKATLTVAESSASGNYGVYVFPGSGATDATQELATLVSLAS